MSNKDIALQMFKEEPNYIDDARQFVSVGNTVVGSLISILYGVPRQYAEQAVQEALDELENEE